MPENNQEKKNDPLDESIVFAQERFKRYTAEASKISRQLAFAEGAIFWIIYLLMQNGSKWILVSFYFSLVLFFILDLLQYLYGANKFESEEEAIKKIQVLNKGKKDINYEIGDEIGNNIKKFFNIKLIMLGISTLFLIILFISFLNTEKDHVIAKIHHKLINLPLNQRTSNYQ
ncbi:TPA: hypothetical protein I8034_000464 [Legionella pneumophila]|nr:hypothetical protein [Legionella pneumophila subsp. fraseri]HAT1771127.1 hypothetical protein [Legionella pneumophila]MDX1845546.1 hypothetical protein [Legionella pneumophila subsp. fraseri]HAT2135036.1 hypothetical protein [Legionella pneumophila]HAT2141155.1 hypothetical protein [Legionella pneumophila]